MSYQEFLEKLAQTRRQWAIVGPYEADCPGEDLIRAGECCPLQAVIPDWASMKTIPTEPLWWSIVRHAADGHTLMTNRHAYRYWSQAPVDPMVFDAMASCRADLLKACGLA